MSYAESQTEVQKGDLSLPKCRKMERAIPNNFRVNKHWRKYSLEIGKKSNKQNEEAILPGGPLRAEDHWEARFPFLLLSQLVQEKIPGIFDSWSYSPLIGFCNHVFQSSFEFQITDTLEHCKPKYVMTTWLLAMLIHKGKQMPSQMAYGRTWSRADSLIGVLIDWLTDIH